MPYLIKATFVEGYWGVCPGVSRTAGIMPRRYATMYPLPRDLPLKIKWMFQEAELCDYDEQGDPVGWYRADGAVVAKVVLDETDRP